MGERIEDGRGLGTEAHVDLNHNLHTFSVIEDEQRQALKEGNEFNINSGNIPLTGTADSSLLYFKNDEDASFVITAVVVGVGTRSATVTDTTNITIIRNPTGGDIISDETVVSMSSNTNFGSSKELKTTTLSYKGKDGGTITGGTDHALFYQSDGRLYAPVNVELPKGSSMGVKIDINTSGGCNVYCALIGFIKDTRND